MPTWFVRFTDFASDFLAVVTPPPNLDWSSQMYLLQQRVDSRELPDDSQSFFGNLDSSAFVVRSVAAQTPALSLREPNIALDVATAYVIRRQDDELIEDLIIETASTNQSPEQLRIALGPSNNRPPMVWKLRGDDNQPPIRLSNSDIVLDNAIDGVYKIDLSQLNLRGKRLVGHRRYPFESVNQDNAQSPATLLETNLPVVIGATSHDAEVLIGSGLAVNKSSESVLRVPVDHPFGVGDRWESIFTFPQQSIENQIAPELQETLESTSEAISSESSRRIGSDGLVSGSRDSRLRKSQSSFKSSRIATRLQYNSADALSITLTECASENESNFVWNQDVNVIASSHGTDRIEAVFRVSAMTDIEIQYPAEMQLMQLTRNDKPIDIVNRDVRPLRLEPMITEGGDSPVEMIRLVWNRQQFSRRWWRSCKMPAIKVSGVVLDQTYSVRASSDSFLPRSLVSNDSYRKFVLVDAGQAVWLVRRNNALALGWLFAISLFAVHWWFARASLVFSFALVLLLSLFTFLWWPWHSVLIGWMLIPAATASLLVATTQWHDRGGKKTVPNGSGDSGDAEDKGASTKQLENKQSDSDFSFDLSTTSLAILICSTFSFSAMTASAQNAMPTPNFADSIGDLPAEKTDASKKRTVEVLVPVDAMGEVLGDKVYLPRKVKSELLASGNHLFPEDARFESANYRLRIASSDGSSRTNLPLIDAEFVLHADRATDRINIPINPTMIRRIEWSQNGQDRIVQFDAVSANSIVARVPMGKSFRLKMTLIPKWVSGDSKSRLTAEIPKVVASKLTIEGGGDIERVRVDDAIGQVIAERELQLWTADIGPIGRLSVAIDFFQEQSSLEEQKILRRYWLHCGQQRTTVECQLEQTQTIAADDTLSVFIRDSLLPTLASPTWRIEQSELLSPTRRHVTFRATVDNAGPIQLLWSLTSRMSTQETIDDAIAMVIPDVVPAWSNEPEPAWIGINAESQIRVLPITRQPLEALTDDQFLAAWSGYRGKKPDRTFIAVGQLPNFYFIANQNITNTVEQTHHINVSGDLIEIEYAAVISDRDPSASRVVLVMPSSVSLARLTVNGTPQSQSLIKTDFINEIVVDHEKQLPQTTITATATIPIESNRQFRLPRLSIAGTGRTSDTFTVSRDSTTRLSVASPLPSELHGLTLDRDFEDLSRGRVPFMKFSYDSSNFGRTTNVPSLQIKVNPKPNSFAVNQLIVLSRVAQRWQMQMIAKFPKGPLPDFVDIEVPTRWCDDLDVTPASKWLRQPAGDLSTQLVRVACDKQIRDSRTLMISGTLAAADKSRVSVPSIVILGEGPRHVAVSVPQKLTNEPIRWRTKSVRNSKRPSIWGSVLEELGLMESRNHFVVANNPWSVELAPMRQKNITASIVAADTRVYPQNDRVIVVSHFDLVPGSRDNITLQLPARSKMISAMSANQPVAFSTAVRDAKKKEQDKATSEVINVHLPLALSRLPQSMDVVFEVSTLDGRRGNYVPKIESLPIREHWVSIYQPMLPQDRNSQAARGRKVTGQTTAQRSFWLANASTVLIDRANDLLAERPAAEANAWLRTVLARYNQLMLEARRTPVVVLSEEQPFDESSDLTETQSRDLMISSSKGLDFAGYGTWDDLDEAIRGRMKRYRTDNSHQSLSLVNPLHIQTYQVQAIYTLEENDSPPAISMVGYRETNLRAWIVNLITMLCGLVLVIVLWPFRERANAMVAHPAFWLAAIAVLGFYIAPVPVAAALLLVALSLPAFPSRAK